MSRSLARRKVQRYRRSSAAGVCLCHVADGFDAPSCSTVYLDKPMRKSHVMQTIARANRVFPGKHSGVIVDYSNVFASLKKPSPSTVQQRRSEPGQGQNAACRGIARSDRGGYGFLFETGRQSCGDGGFAMAGWNVLPPLKTPSMH